MQFINWIPKDVPLPKTAKRVLAFTDSQDETMRYRIVDATLFPKLAEASFYSILHDPK